MFVSTDLAARIESAEARLTRTVGEGVVAEGSRPDAFVETISRGVAAYVGPSSPMNKMIGIGFGLLPSKDQLRAIEQKFERRQASLQAEVSTLADPACASELTRRGYMLRGFENVLGRPITSFTAGAEDHSAIEISAITEVEFPSWLDVMVAGFISPDDQGVGAEELPGPDALRRALTDIASTPDMKRYLARIDGAVAGAATLRFDNRLAQLCGAATLRAFRRRGVQTALLRRRLVDAGLANCDLALMTALPGSKSQQNAQRQSFELLYSRALLVKDPANF